MGDPSPYVSLQYVPSISLHASLQYISTCVPSVHLYIRPFQSKQTSSGFQVDGESFSLSLHYIPSIYLYMRPFSTYQHASLSFIQSTLGGIRGRFWGRTSCGATGSHQSNSDITLAICLKFFFGFSDPANFLHQPASSAPFSQLAPLPSAS
jgi:hypothetical protein